jgi:hypothetical protein
MGASKGEIDTLQLRRKTFIDVVGDKPIDGYSGTDLNNGIWQRVPKTGEFAACFVLHNFLVEIGFVDWGAHAGRQVAVRCRARASGSVEVRLEGDGSPAAAHRCA